MSEINYKVKYLEISSKIIHNFFHPSDARVKRLNDQNKFYTRLEESIKQHGILNPILVNAGHIANHHWQNLPNSIKTRGMDKLVVADYIGCSRLYVAQRLGWTIPCIVSDFVDMFDGEILETEQQVMSKFTTKPKFVEWGVDGLRISTLEHFHLAKK